MAFKLVAQGGNDVESFKRAVAQTSGDGVTLIELDIRDKVAIRFSPDINVGAIVRRALPVLDRSISAIPGVHLVAPSAYAVIGSVGTIRVKLRTNPLPSVPVVVAGAMLGALGPAGLVLHLLLLKWRIFHEEPKAARPDLIAPPDKKDSGFSLGDIVGHDGEVKKFLLPALVGLVALVALVAVRR